MIGKYRGSAHWVIMIKKVLVIFHNLIGYLIIEEINKFDVKISVIPNGLEKYMAFAINNNLPFIDSIYEI